MGMSLWYNISELFSQSMGDKERERYWSELNRMNSAILLIPLFLIRYGLLLLINKNALPKAAFFPPMRGPEKVMHWVYQASTIMFILYMFFLKIRMGAFWLYVGLTVYTLGVLLFALSTISFAKPNIDGFNQNGLYRISRNPMYVAYFIYFLGCVFLTQSIVLFVLLCVFQLSAHWIILSEERWCRNSFGEKYVRYSQKVRRYI